MDELLVIVPVIVLVLETVIPVVILVPVVEVSCPSSKDQEAFSSSKELIVGIVSQLTLKICIPVHESCSCKWSFSSVPFT